MDKNAHESWKHKYLCYFTFYKWKMSLITLYVLAYVFSLYEHPEMRLGRHLEGQLDDISLFHVSHPSIG